MVVTTESLDRRGIIAALNDGDIIMKLITYYEPPHSVFETLTKPQFQDPGDGLGNVEVLDGFLLLKIKKAFDWDMEALIECIKLLGEHEYLKIKGEAWAPRGKRRVSCETEAPPISDVLIMLDIATELETHPMFWTRPFPCIRFNDWAVDFALSRDGAGMIDHTILEEWHDKGSYEESRLPQLFSR